MSPSTRFNGAELGYARLLAIGNPEAAALEFFRFRFEVLTATP